MTMAYFKNFQSSSRENAKSNIRPKKNVYVGGYILKN